MKKQTTVFKAIDSSPTSLYVKDTNIHVEPMGSFTVGNEYTVNYPDGKTRTLRYYLGCVSIYKDEQVQSGNDPHPKISVVDAIWFQNHHKYVSSSDHPLLHKFLSEIPPCKQSPHQGDRKILYYIVDTNSEEEAKLLKIEELENIYSAIKKLSGNSELLRKAAQLLGIDPNKGNAGIIIEMRKKAEMEDKNGNNIGMARVSAVLSNFEDDIIATIEEAIGLGVLVETDRAYFGSTEEKIKAFQSKEQSQSKNRQRLAKWFKTEEGQVQYLLIKDQIKAVQAKGFNS